MEEYYEKKPSTDSSLGPRVRARRRAHKKEKRKSGVGSFLLTLVIAIAIGLFLKFFVVSFVNVEGDSMQTTFHTGNKVFTERVTYYFSQPKRGDVIVCRYQNFPDHYIKRVIGLPGETLEIRDSQLFINGTVVEEPYLDESVYPLEDFGPVTVQPEHVFVMGDNRHHSLDSRSESVGQIPFGDINGHVILKVWPLGEFGGF